MEIVIFSSLNTYRCNHAGCWNTQKFSFIILAEENWLACLIFKTYSRKQKFKMKFHKKTISEINANTISIWSKESIVLAWWGVVVWVSLHGWAWYPGHLLQMKEGRISQQNVSPLIISPFPFYQIYPHYTYLTDSRSWKLSLEVPFPSPKWALEVMCHIAWCEFI